MRKLRSQEGFTLVELAVVMVIIGIILGGIVKGATLIQNARGERALNDIKGLEAMAWTFNNRYGFLPGDCDRNGLVGASVTGDVTLDDLTDDTTAPAALCTAEDDINQPLDSLRYAGIASRTSSNRVQFKHALQGPYLLGNQTVNDIAYNVIAATQIPCWAAKMIDRSLDGDVDSGTGRVRSLADTGVNTTSTPDWTDVCPSEDTLAGFVYMFDMEP